MKNEYKSKIKYERRKAKRLGKKHKNNIEYDNFDNVFTYEHMRESCMKAKCGVMWKSSVQTYLANAPLNITKDLNQLKDEKYKSKGFYNFDIFERGKLRHIQSVSFGERVVQRCLCDYSMVPVFSKTFIYDNGASLKRKGYTFSVKRIQRHLRHHINKHGTNGYILILDFSKYFDNISHDYIKSLVRREYTDERLINLIFYFIDQFEGEKGIGLGSQISQILALAAANSFDHFIKEELKIEGYGRYMDDSYLIHQDKKYLEYCLEKIRSKCNEIGIILNEKKVRICKITQPFTFLKIRFFVTDSGKIVKRIYKNSSVRMRRKLKKFKIFLDSGYMSMNDIYQAYQSWESHAKIFDSYHAIQNMRKLYISLFKDYIDKELKPCIK